MEALTFPRKIHEQTSKYRRGPVDSGQRSHDSWSHTPFQTKLCDFDWAFLVFKDSSLLEYIIYHYIYTCLHAIFHNGLASIPEGILHMICGKVAFKIDKIASSLSSHSPEELISKSFDYVLAKGKNSCQNPWTLETCSGQNKCGHTITLAWKSMAELPNSNFSKDAIENLCEFHRDVRPPHPNRLYKQLYKHICGMYSWISKKIYQTSHPLVDPGFDARGWWNTKFGPLAAETGNRNGENVQGLKLDGWKESNCLNMLFFKKGCC